MLQWFFESTPALAISSFLYLFHLFIFYTIIISLLFLYTSATNSVKGDMLVIAGATLYAISKSNATEVRYFTLWKTISGLSKTK
jgi:hypothetical protein